MGIFRRGSLVLAGLLLSTLPLRAEVLVSHGISTFGDLKYPADFPHLEYVNPDAPKGGEISVWSFGGFDSMNPYSVKGRAGALSSVFYESLLTDVADETGSAYCLLCENLEYPPGREWVIFNLREGAKFSDGSPLTAEDVAFSYELFLTKGLTDFRTVLAQQVEGVEVLGPHRVKFTFKAGFPTRDLPQTVGGLPVLSKAQYEASGGDLEEGSTTPFLGSGPYVLDRMEMGKTLTYKRNPDYWGGELPINKGRGNFDRIRIEYYADYNAAFEGFKAGNYTFRDEASSITWATGYDFPAVTSGAVKKVQLPSGTKASGQGFLINLRREKFQDPRVRQAIGLMFNFEWSNETLFYGLYERVNSVWENSVLEATGVPGPEEVAVLKPLVDEGLLPEAILTEEAVMAPVSGERQLDRGNLRRASALLEEAGWVAGADGIRRNAKGETLKLEILNDSQTFDRVILPYVENLRRAGIDATMTRIDNAQLEARERPPAYDFDMVVGNARASLIPGAELKQFFGSETADVSAFNLMGLKSKAADRLIEQVIAATTREEMETRTRALDRVLRREYFWVPQWFKADHTVAYYDLFGHPEVLPPFSRGELDFWWYDEEKAAAVKAAGVLR
ncbi:extracellular solute-binding protein [Falsigemmobacter intermedius]|uniref:ABC transporter substrate-binding protein n=1 Tax=Falsigemmobacter intermedius TaxID=1553448 RepID=A0A444M9B6_9RHOB|nr:extracellular solute-binding protein [Falsigemmobacter intermedius]RWY39516.1 ABC transporter substrate-binding protein [Falsigemmobacter intermedius]